MLAEAGLRPAKRFGQNFLTDLNVMRTLIERAEVTDEQTVLEVGPGTGSLTEELLAGAARVVAVEIDRGLVELLKLRLSDRKNLTLIGEDVLAGKHRIAPRVLDALGAAATMVSNLPFAVATPLVVECLLNSWRSVHGRGERMPGRGCRFDRLTFTVQREVADRLAARPPGKDYGPVSVVAALLGRVVLGATIPPSAFWPRPNVSGRIVRIDFDAGAAERLADAETLSALLRLVFAQRRKQLASAIGRKNCPFSAEALSAALAAADIKATQRAETVAPEQFLVVANALSVG